MSVVWREGVRSHPQGVQPWGNSLLVTGARLWRAEGLGSRAFAALTDDLLLELLRLLPAFSCGRLACASPVLHAFCCHEDLWREYCTQLVHAGHVRFRWAPEGTWRATYVHSTSSATRRPATCQSTVAKVYSDVLFQNFRCFRAEIEAGWLVHNNMDRVDARGLSVEEFLRCFEQRSRPVIIENAIEAWPATQSWTKETLLDRFGDVCFEVGPCELPLREFWAYADRNLDDVPLFVFCKLFSHRAPSMISEYNVPDMFRGRDLFDLLGDDRPDFRWLLVGNRRSGSKWHLDPNKTCAWNAVIRGRKRWVMLPPGCVPPGVKTTPDGSEVTQPVSLVEWFQTFYAEMRKRTKEASWDLKEGVCGPGECVFVPSGWWHCVLNLDDNTIAITQNYASETHIHSIRRFLREKSVQVSGVRSKAALAERFDAALHDHRPDLLTVVPAEKRGGPPSFSFWEHLRSTGSSLSFGAAPTPPPAATCRDPEATLDELPDAKRPKRSEEAADGAQLGDESASDWLSSL